MQSAGPGKCDSVCDWDSDAAWTRIEPDQRRDREGASGKARGNSDVTLNAGNLRRLRAGGRQDCLPYNFSRSREGALTNEAAGYCITLENPALVYAIARCAPTSLSASW